MKIAPRKIFDKNFTMKYTAKPESVEENEWSTVGHGGKTINKPTHKPYQNRPHY